MDAYPAFSKSPPALGREPSYGGRDDPGRTGNDGYRRRSPGKLMPCRCLRLMFLSDSSR